MKLAGIETKNNIFLAPMAGVCDRAFREICMQMGAGMCFSEMISAKAVCYGDKKTRKLIAFSEIERPYIVQLFGCEPDFVAEAIRIIEAEGFNPDGFDINMGCPAPKIVSNGEGSALMKNPDTAYDVMRAARGATKLPVSVKHRSGWDKSSVNAVEFAKRMEDAGASFITVHPRTRDQFYALRADLNVLRDVKAAVSVPVIGSGDLFTADDVVKMLDYTGCDGVMLARGAHGNPWLFKEALCALEGGEFVRPTIDERIEMMMKHGALMSEYKGELPAMREFRRHINQYIKGMRDATSFKNRANSVSTLEDLRSLLEDIAAHSRQTSL